MREIDIFYKDLSGNFRCETVERVRLSDVENYCRKYGSCEVRELDGTYRDRTLFVLKEGSLTVAAFDKLGDAVEKLPPAFTGD